MAISFGSINTGLPKDIVKQIIAAEKIPVERMKARKEKIGEKQKLLTELTGLVEGVRGELAKNASARSFRELKISTNEEIINVTADKNIAEPGSYQFEVVDLARKSSAMTSGFEDPDDSYVGVGFIQYYMPDGEVKDVYVDSDNASLRSIAKLINSDSETGMRASVVNDGSGSDTPWRLIVSLKETGDEKLAEFPYFYFVDGEQDLYLEFEREAQDAMIKMDGFELEVPENKASELIAGVTIDLKKAMPGEEFTIKIEEDVEKITEKVQFLIDKINDVFKFIQTQNNLDENTDTTRTLGGDLTLQTIESRLRGAILQPVQTSTGPKRLGDLGIRFQRDGMLSVEANKLQSALSKDFTNVSQILNGYFPPEGNGKTEGLIDRVSEVVKATLRYPNGVLPSRKTGIQTKIDQIDQRIADKERLLEQKEKNLKDKFARLEGTISRIKSQGAGLAGLSGASDPVTKLG